MIEKLLANMSNMSRTIKQLVYGVLFCVVLLFVLFVFLKPYFVFSPTCDDDVQNQDETGIDCGGSCELCEVQQARPLVISSKPRLFVFGDEARVLFSVRNPNFRFQASFSYLISASGTPSAFKVESSSIRAGEEKMVLVQALPVQFLSNSGVSLVLRNTVFTIDDPASQPQVAVLGDIGTNFTSQSRFVKIRVTNTGVVKASKVEVVALVGNQYATPIFPGATVIDELVPSEIREVTIPFPRNLDLSFVATSTTRVYLSAL